MPDQTLEWIITLHNHEDLEDFYNDMETPGGNLFIPDRAVGVEKRRSISRNTHYMLTPAEAALIKQDERVWDVDMADMIVNVPTYEFNGDFDKTTSGDADHINWGILRHTIEDNLSNWGLPGTSGFLGEFLVLAGAFQKNYLVSMLATFGVVLGAAYMLWLTKRVIFGNTNNNEIKNLKDINNLEALMLITLAILVILFGFYPSPLMDTLNISVDNLINNYEIAIRANGLN